MKVTYGATNLNATPKNLTMKETASKPIVSGIPTDGCYTLVMIDPDAGKANKNSPRTGKYYLHWLVTNITDGSVERGQTKGTYAPPTPPSGSGPHEYRFQLYKQECGILNTKQITAPMANIDLDRFENEMRLILLPEHQAKMKVES